METVRIELANHGHRPGRHPLLEDNQAPENRLTEAMTLHKFQGLVDMNPSWRRLLLQGNGEPLLVPNLTEMIRYAGQQHMQTTLWTNGTLLYRDRAEELILAGLDRLMVVMGPAATPVDLGPLPPESATLPVDYFARHWLENLHGLITARQAMGAPGPRVQVAYRLDRRTAPLLVDTVWLLGSTGITTEVALINAGPLPAVQRDQLMDRAHDAAQEWGVGLGVMSDRPSRRPYLTMDGLWRLPAEELDHPGELDIARQREERARKDDLRHPILRASMAGE